MSSCDCQELKGGYGILIYLLNNPPDHELCTWILIECRWLLSWLVGRVAEATRYYNVSSYWCSDGKLSMELAKDTFTTVALTNNPDYDSYITNAKVVLITEQSRWPVPKLIVAFKSNMIGNPRTARKITLFPKAKDINTGTLLW